MEIRKTGGETYAMAYVLFENGEEFIAENGSMVAISAGINIVATLDGGIGKAIGRKLFADEGFFFTKYRADYGGSWVAVSPKYPGDIYISDLTGEEPLRVQTGSVLGYGSNIEKKVVYTGIKTALMKEGLTAFEVSGVGLTLISSYGAIEELKLGTGQELIVDTSHLVAWSQSATLSLDIAGDIITQALSGEGLVLKLTATRDNTKVLLQTRSEQQLFNWITPTRYQNQV